MPLHPVEQRVGVPEVFVERFRRKVVLPCPPTDKTFRSDVAQKAPAAFLHRQLQPTTNMGDASTSTIALDQARDEIFAMFGEFDVRGFAERFRSEQSDELLFAFLDQLASLDLRDFA